MMPEPPIGENRPPQFTLISLFVVMTVVALLLGLLVPSIRSAREAARRAQCANNLKQVGLALHNYHDVWKMLPEAQTLDAQGRAVHGWRIRVVPFVEKGMVYARHTFNEPWDGPTNLRLHGIPLAYFACPSDPSWPGPNVSYLAVVGNETAWPAGQGTRFRDFRDGLSNSLMVVEAAQSGIHWLEPRDLAFDEFDYTINSDSGRGIRSKHPGGANVLYGDGSVRRLSVATSPDVLRSLLTIAGGEEIPEDWER